MWVAMEMCDAQNVGNCQSKIFIVGQGEGLFSHKDMKETSERSRFVTERYADSESANTCWVIYYQSPLPH